MVVYVISCCFDRLGICGRSHFQSGEGKTWVGLIKRLNQKERNLCTTQIFVSVMFSPWLRITELCRILPPEPHELIHRAWVLPLYLIHRAWVLPLYLIHRAWVLPLYLIHRGSESSPLLHVLGAPGICRYTANPLLMLRESQGVQDDQLFPHSILYTDILQVISQAEIWQSTR